MEMLSISFHFNIDLSGGPCVMKRLVGCGSGTEYLAITPTGELYPCHQFVGMPEFKMVQYMKALPIHNKEKFFQNVMYMQKEDCKKCWAKFYCSGGCAANAYQQNGDILKPYEIGCKMQKKKNRMCHYDKSKRNC